MKQTLLCLTKRRQHQTKEQSMYVSLGRATGLPVQTTCLGNNLPQILQSCEGVVPAEENNQTISELSPCQLSVLMSYLLFQMLVCLNCPVSTFIYGSRWHWLGCLQVQRVASLLKTCLHIVLSAGIYGEITSSLRADVGSVSVSFPCRTPIFLTGSH